MWSVAHKCPWRGSDERKQKRVMQCDAMINTCVRVIPWLQNVCMRMYAVCVWLRRDERETRETEER